MQEEWHRDERKCTFVILARNLLLLDLDIVNDDRPSVAVASPSHIPWQSRHHRAVNHRHPRAVHRRRCRRIAVALSIAVAVAPSIAVAVVPSIAVVAIAPPLCHSLSLLHAFHCRRRRRVAIEPSIAVHHRRHCAAVASPSSPLPSLSLLPPPPPPAFADPFIGWLLRCCPPSAFVIACRLATVDDLVAGRFRR